MSKKQYSAPRARASSLAAALLVMTTVVVGGCDKVPLLAPTSSTITVSAPAQVLASGGSAEITAYVLEQSGTPVQNGTTVRFSSTLGRVEPVEAQTTNGLATTMFFADGSSGVAEIRATSGAAGGGAGWFGLRACDSLTAGHTSMRDWPGVH